MVRLSAAPGGLARFVVPGYAHSRMQRAIIVRGRLSGPRRIDLDESVDDITGEVEVVVRPIERVEAKPQQDIFAFLRSLPPGARSKENIDRQIAEERDSWANT